MKRRYLTSAGIVCGLLFIGVQLAWAQLDVTQPGDDIVPSSPNNPGSEGVANAIDNQPTKYLNFDADDGTDVGFVVTPSVGLTRVTGLAMQSANDAPERDPRLVALDGSNADAAPAWDEEAAWTRIADITVPAYTARFETQTFLFDNLLPFKHYRWIVLEVQDVAAANSMQIAEVELLGTVVPGDVTQPGDDIVASSPNNPGSEGVANAIDGQQTKYLNFDAADGTDVGFVVSPSIGRTLVTGIAMQSANDAPERDPYLVALDGSNAADVPTWGDDAAWTRIVDITVPAYTARFETQTFLFDNYIPYRHYRWIVLEVADVAAANSMQIAEVELLGTGEPKDVTQPGDVIVPSSPNNPGSEGVANAIDNQPTKYLNFDAADGTDVGFVVTPGVGATTVIGMTIQSANDAPERDPSIVALDGSNADPVPGWADDVAWERIVEFTAPAFTARFETQEFFFPNSRAYKHYRWVVLEVADVAAANSMQVAEVELLAPTAQADCSKAAFVTLPLDTPVLSGQSATFVTVVNGPWPLQWYKNGERISGATSASYTTDPVTTANENDEYTVEIVGCVTSPPVKATVFTLSSIKSVGLSWEGGGANGAPTAILPTDIAGVHLQAYWNNMVDQTAIVSDLVDSDNALSDVYVDFASSGEWGAGTGIDLPRQRLLNGLIYANPGTPGYVTFGGVPAGEHSVIAYTVGIPLQFQDQDYVVMGASEQRIYTQQQNADQYNPNPEWVRGTSTDPNARTEANYVRFDKVQPDTAEQIRLEWSTATTGFDRGVALNAIQLLINPGDVGTPPALVTGPQPTETLEGGTVVLAVEATGADLTYQWRKNGLNIFDGGNTSGATSAELTIRGFAPDDVGFYSVRVANAAGSFITPAVKVKIVAEDRTISDALIAHFKFNESAGATAANSGSDPYDGSVNNGLFVPGQIGNALDFDAFSTYVLVPNYTKIQEEVTVAAWVWIDPDSTAYTTPFVFLRNADGDLAVSAPLEQFEFGLANTAGGLNLRVALAVGPNFAVVSENAPFPLGEWHHVAFTADGRQIRLYRDGALVGTGSYLDPINQPDIQWLSIGARLAGDPPILDATPNVLFGRMDDLGIWRFAWSQDVIASIHEKGVAGQDLLNAVLPELPPVPTDVVLTATLGGDGSVTISRDVAGGTLESAPAVTGPWTAVPGNPSPHVIPAPTGTEYFRIVP